MLHPVRGERRKLSLRSISINHFSKTYLIPVLDLYWEIWVSHSHFIMHNWYVDIPGCQGKFDLKHSHFVLKNKWLLLLIPQLKNDFKSSFWRMGPAYMNGLLCGSASLRLAFHCQGSQAGMISNSLCYYTLTNETRCFPCHRALVTSLSVMIFEI